MKQFDYVIKDAVGIHARPAGLLVKEAKNFTSKITIEKGEKKADATRLIALMGMGIKCGDKITVTCEGDDEDAACEAMSAFLNRNL